MVEFEPVDLSAVRKKPHSYRNWEPELLVRIAFQEGEHQAREFLKFIEAGRFDEMLTVRANP